jgi:pimeloyl-ACP methyl ester carboxylesterase
VIAYHRRGYRGSGMGTPAASIADQAEDAAALLDHLGVPSAHVGGHSYGGVIALQLAHD